MGPARQGFRTPDPACAKVDLGLVSYPDLAAIDRIVELAQERQAPVGILETFRIMIFPAQPLAGGFVGGDQRAAEPIVDRAAASDLDTEADGDVERFAVDFRRAAKKRVEG